MQEILKLQKKIVPELIELIEKRYNILKNIYYNQPIGRRILATNLGMGERVVRTEINFLKNQNLIDINAPGMTVTVEGEEIITKLKDFIYELKGLYEIEDFLKKSLNLKDVIIVPGNLEEDDTVCKELGKAGANYIKNKLQDEINISLTGGTSVKAVVDNIPKINKLNNVIVLPARGGMGKKVETQANTLAAKLAIKLNANYKLLHFPDKLSGASLNAILNEPDVKQLVEKIQVSDMLIFGIGEAEKMAIRRDMTKEEVDYLMEKGAVAEAFGYYFNQKGEIVYFTPTIGIRREDIKNIDLPIAIAGGKNKGKAILAAELNMQSGSLITDEAAAREMVKILTEELN